MKNFKRDGKHLSERAIRSLLSSKGKFANIPVLVAEELRSTNDTAKEMARQGIDGPICIIAESQTAGRGRLGRSFYSPKGRGLFFTLVIPYKASEEMLLFTRAAAVACRRAIKKVCDLDVGIKWVNDIIYRGKKAGGILSESEGDFVFIGIGINCYGKEFPKEIKDIAISLSPSGEISFDRNLLAGEIIYEILTMAGDLRDEKILEEYDRASTILGKRVQVSGKCTKTPVSGTVAGFTEEGGIVIIDQKNRRLEVHSGEISVLL